MNNDEFLREAARREAFRQGSRHHMWLFSRPWQNPYLGQDDELAKQWRAGWDQEERIASMWV